MSANDSQLKSNRQRMIHDRAIDTRLLDKIPDAAIITDLSGVIIYWNDSATRLFGWTSQEMVGRPYIERFPESARSWLSEELQKRQDGQTWVGEFEDYRKDGSRIWIDATVSCIDDREGRPIAILGISHDITIRKTTEMQLRESQHRLAEAQKLAKMASWCWDPNTQKVWWSDAIYELFGVEPGKVQPSFQAFLSLLHPDDRPTAIRRANAVHAGSEMEANDLRLIRPDGQLIWIHSKSRAVRDANGHILLVEGTDQDITERKLAEQRLKLSEERYRAFVDHNLDAVTIHDRSGRIIDVNHQACIALGYTREELIGMLPYEFDTKTSRKDFEKYEADLNEGRQTRFETCHRRRDGTVFPVEVRIRPFPYAGECAHLAFARDLTQFKQTERSLWESQYLLQRIGDNLPGGFIFRYQYRPGGEHRVIYASKGVEEVLGVDADALCMDPNILSQLMDQANSKKLRDSLDQSLRDGSKLDIELQVVRQSQQKRWIHVRATPRQEEDGSTVWDGVVIDVTERNLVELALRTSEERLRLATTATNDAIWDYDVASGDVTWNENYSRDFARTEGESNSQWWVERIHVDDRQRVHQSFANAITGASSHWSANYRFKKSDGSWAEVEDRAYITRDEHGKARRIVGAMRNVTERNKAERALRESEERFRSVLDHSPVLVFLEDLDGRYLFMNEKCAEAWGVRPGEWLGKTAADFLPADVAERFNQHCQRLVTENRIQHIQEEILWNDGARHRLLVVLFPLVDPNGEMYAICGIATDVTQWQRTQEERDRLWNNAPYLILIASHAGIIEQVNPAWTRQLGWQAHELTGQSVRDLVYGADRADFDEMLATLCIGDTVNTTTFRMVCKDGSTRWTSWNPVNSPTKGSWYGFGRDVTEKKRLEAQFRQSQKMEAIGQLAGGVAHDFNNLLTVIRGYSELLINDCVDQPSTMEQLKAICEASDRASGLTAQLLAFSRKAIIDPKVLDLNHTVEGTTRMLRRLIGEDIRLECELDPNLLKVRIDPVQLEQILMNLAINARDAMPRGGVLRITTRNRIDEDVHVSDRASARPTLWVELSIEDNGIGMDEEVKAHLFEPFYTTKGIGRGTGLGLATVYGIVHQANGTVQVESQIGAGSTFRVLLPAFVEPSEDERFGQLRGTNQGHGTILLVEDEEAVRELAQLILNSSGYDVLTARCGNEALDIVRDTNRNIDLLLSDVVMPDLSGSELARQVQQMRPGIRVLYMSGYTDDQIVRGGVRTSTNSFLQKPFTPSSLTGKILEVLREPS